MKILLVHNSYQRPGGEDVVCEREADLLRSAGHEVLEFRRHNDEIKDYSRVQRLGLACRTIWAPDSYRDLSLLLRRERPDVVHAHNTFPLVSPSLFSACRATETPVVQTLHNYRLLCPGSNFFRDGRTCHDCAPRKFWNGVVHGCYRNSRGQTAAVALMLAVHHARKTWTSMVHRYIALTQFSRKLFLDAGFPEHLVTVKPNFVSPDPGKRPENGSYALFVGRFDREKGLSTILRSWQQLSWRIPLTLVGDGSQRREVELVTQSHPNISVTGWCSKSEVFQIMRRARFLIFPSEWYENLPLTIIEAFACGVPVIGSNLGAMQEIIADRHTGLLFKSGNVDELTRLVSEMWDQPDYTMKLGDAARKEYEAKYTADANYRQLIGIYRDVISEYRRAPAIADAIDAVADMNVQQAG